MTKRISLLALLLFFPATSAFAQDDDTPDENQDVAQSDEGSAENPQISNAESFEMAVQQQKPDHTIRIALFPQDKTIKAKLVTSKGDISCDLYAGQHPLTVMNFVALATAKPPWEDESGNKHTLPYYSDLKMGTRAKGAYVATSARPEGTAFVVPDERCKTHPPKAGAIAMVQHQPGMASAQFILLARDIPEFNGLYPIFGQCAPIETIKTLTQEDATLLRVELDQ